MNTHTQVVASEKGLQAPLFSSVGAAEGTIMLPGTVFDVAWNADLVHGVVLAMQANARAGTAHTKDRSEVSGGGKKPWKQKGTGRARHGSSRSPIWAGGGVAHGPRSDKDYTTKINKKMRAKALAAVFTKKLADTEMIFLSDVAMVEPKTAIGKTIITAIATATGHPDLATKRKNAALLILDKRNEMIEKSFHNFGNIEVVQVKDINPVDILTYKYVIMVNSNDTLRVLEKRIAPVSPKITNVK
jgi:large subunit ribosomal protein L4